MAKVNKNLHPRSRKALRQSSDMKRQKKLAMAQKDRKLRRDRDLSKPLDFLESIKKYCSEKTGPECNLDEAIQLWFNKYLNDLKEKAEHEKKHGQSLVKKGVSEAAYRKFRSESVRIGEEFPFIQHEETLKKFLQWNGNYTYYQGLRKRIYKRILGENEEDV